MTYTDFSGRRYSEAVLIYYAREKWKFLEFVGDYYFIQDFPFRELTTAETALKFLNNYYETDKRKISFWRLEQ